MKNDTRQGALDLCARLIEFAEDFNSCIADHIGCEELRQEALILRDRLINEALYEAAVECARQTVNVGSTDNLRRRFVEGEYGVDWELADADLEYAEGHLGRKQSRGNNLTGEEVHEFRLAFECEVCRLLGEGDTDVDG